MRTDGWQLGTPDLVVTMPEPYVLPAEGADVFRTFVIPIPLTRPRYVRGLEFRSGATRAVHHANVKIDTSRSSRRLDEEEAGPGFDGGSSREARFPDGHFLGWTPGQMPRAAEGDRLAAARRKRSRRRGAHDADRQAGASSAAGGLYFTDDAPARVPTMIRLGSQRIDIPAGAAELRDDRSYRLPVDVDVARPSSRTRTISRGGWRDTRGCRTARRDG